jgi:hypothetical protein
MNIQKAAYFTLGFIIGFAITIISSAMNILDQPNLGIVCTSSSFVVGVYKFIKSHINNSKDFSLLDLLIITSGGAIYFFA